MLGIKEEKRFVLRQHQTHKSPKQVVTKQCFFYILVYQQLYSKFLVYMLLLQLYYTVNISSILVWKYVRILIIIIIRDSFCILLVPSRILATEE